MRINISYFLNFVQLLRDFRVSSPKCAFLTDTRKREEIINGIQCLIHRLALCGCSSDFKSGNSPNAALRKVGPLSPAGPESFVAIGERSYVQQVAVTFRLVPLLSFSLDLHRFPCFSRSCVHFQGHICRSICFILTASSTRDTIFLLSNN